MEELTFSTSYDRSTPTSAPWCWIGDPTALAAIDKYADCFDGTGGE